MEKETMKKPAQSNSREFTEQEAPEKNTDNAFVRVGTDGHPEIPEEKETEKEEEASVRRSS